MVISKRDPNTVAFQVAPFLHLLNRIPLEINVMKQRNFMKRFFRLNVRSVLLASTLALVAVIPTAAQTASSSPGDTSSGYTAARTDGRHDGTDWGWLGLLGLTGLLGLIPKRRRQEGNYRATDTASRATAR